MPVVMVFNPSKGYKKLGDFVAYAKGQSRLGQLRLGRRRQFVASQRRAVPAGGRLRSRAPAVQGRAGSDDRGDRRPRRLLLLTAGERAAAAQGRPLQALAVSGSSRASALPDVPTTVRSRHIRTRNTISGPACSRRRRRPPTSAPSSMRRSPRRCSSPAVRDKLKTLGADPMPLTSAQFEALVKQRDRDQHRSW